MKTTTTTRISIAVLSATLAVAGGCYKGEADAQRARADTAEQKAKELETQLAASKREAESAKAQAKVVLDQREQLRQKAVLTTIVNGQVYGTDEVRLTDTGQFLKHGSRTRGATNIRFDSGRLTDQHMIVRRDDGKTYFEGDVKNSRPEGEWIWYTREGKPQIKEIWKDGKLAELHSATVTAAKPAAKPATTPTTTGGNRAVVPGTPAKPTTPPTTPPSATPTGSAAEDKVTWKAMSKGELASRVKDTASIFMNLPELIRE